jgi:hypothetical protein
MQTLKNACITEPSKCLKEEPNAYLHHALTILAINASKCGRVGIGDDVPKHGMIENVERFKPRLKVSSPVFADKKLLQDTGVRREDSRIAQTGEEHGRVGQ